MSASNSKVTTRGALKSINDTADDTSLPPATLQSVDGKLNTIMKILQTNTNDIKEIKNEQRELSTSIELCHTNINDLKDLMKNQDSKINVCNDEIQRLSSENVQLRGKINSLATELHALEQYSHRSNLVIYGVPETENENIQHVMRRLATAIQFPDWSTSLVDAVHRLGRRNNNDPRPIIIKFVSRQDRDEFLKKRKVRRNLKATDLGFSSENSIYINESLTSATRELLKLARDKAKEKNYSQVWTSNCSIFVRKEKGKSPVIKILSVNDLDKM